MFEDELFSKSGGNFPFRRYINGTVDNISKLQYLIEDYVPLYEEEGFDPQRLKGSVVSKMQDGRLYSLFSKGPKNIIRDTDWSYNAVIDQYTETARMSSPGYGKDYSPIDLWFRTSFSKIRDKIMKNSKTLEQGRELIYKEGEVRLAYVTESIGLYNYVKTSILRQSNPNVLDITAFGDRMVAAAATGYNYIGVDPDPNLVDGISRLMSDIKVIKPDFNVGSYTLPLEHFYPSQGLDFISLSPPPYLAEPYSGGDRQVHKVYRDFEHWFYGFLRESLTRAYNWLREDGVLGFSVLDRTDKYQKGLYKISYTEPMILLAIQLGFRPVTIFSLSSGTPWWIFRKSYSDDLDSSRLFNKYYPNLYLNYINKTNNPAIEYLRLLCSEYIVDTCRRHNIFKNSAKTQDLLGRILMSKVPSDEEPDPLFPDVESDLVILDSDINENIRFPIVIQTSDQGYKSVISYSNNIILELYSIIINYLHWIQCTTEYYNFQRKIKVGETKLKNGKRIINLYVNRGDELSVISFLRKRVPFVKDRLDKIKVLPKVVSLWSSTDKGITTKNISSYLRYNAVGLTTHHYTRSNSRVKAIEKIAMDPNIVDLFATPFNANTKLYGSVYPDVDPGSLGNFFNYEGGDYKTFMANPPPYDGFNEKMINRLVKSYLAPFRDRVIFYSTTVWESDGSEYLERIRMKGDPGFDNLDNYYTLTTLWRDYKSYVRAVYILSHRLHPSLDAAKEVQYTEKKRPTESVGVILSSDIKVKLDLSKLDLLSEGYHYIM